MTTMPVLKETTSVFAKGYTPASKAPVPPADAGGAPPSGLPDLTALADDVLAALVERAQDEVKRRKDTRESEFLAMVAETARALSVSPARVAAAISNKSPRQRSTAGTDGRSSVRPKFWCVTDHALRWSGRGGAPKWFSDHISSGGKEEDMRIPDGAQ